MKVLDQYLSPASSLTRTLGYIQSCLHLFSSEPRILTDTQIKQEKYEASLADNQQTSPPTPSIDLSMAATGEGGAEEMGVVEAARVLTMLHADVCAGMSSLCLTQVLQLPQNYDLKGK